MLTLSVIWVLQKLGTLAVISGRQSLPQWGKLWSSREEAEQPWALPRDRRAHSRACPAIATLAWFLHKWLHHHQMSLMNLSVLRASQVRNKGNLKQFESSTYTAIGVLIIESIIMQEKLMCWTPMSVYEPRGYHVCWILCCQHCLTSPSCSVLLKICRRWQGALLGVSSLRDGTGVEVENPRLSKMFYETYHTPGFLLPEILRCERNNMKTTSSFGEK